MWPNGWCRAILLWLTSVNTVFAFCERNVQLGGITLQYYLGNKTCLTFLWRIVVQSSPVQSSLFVGLTNFRGTSATEPMLVVKEVRFWLILIMSDWRVTFVTFCRYVGRKGSMGCFDCALNSWRKACPYHLHCPVPYCFPIRSVLQLDDKRRFVAFSKRMGELKTLSAKLIVLQCSVREMLGWGSSCLYM